MTTTKKPTIGLGILSWEAHKTIRQTLASYQQENLFSLFDQSLIYFNDIGKEDRKIAAENGLPCAGGPNLGIFGGMKGIAKYLEDMDYILFLQNDCPMVEGYEEMHRQLSTAIRLLEEGRIDMMRIRHRWKVGEGFDLHKYLRYFGVSELHPNFSLEETGISKEELPETHLKKIRRILRPRKAKKLQGMSAYLEQKPHLVHPHIIEKTDNVFIVDSSAIPFSEQPFLIGRNFLNTLFDYVEKHPRSRTANGFQTMEVPLNVAFWKNSGFKVGVSTGIFTHNRFDGSFRKTHHAYEG